MTGIIRKSIFIGFFTFGILLYFTGSGFAISDSNKSIQLSVFSLGANGEVTTDPNEVIEGSESFKGHYSGNDSWNEYLYSIPERLPLSPLTKYRVTFDYKILETPDRGFETIFYSPIGGSQNDWLPGQVFYR
jgi:hypothetical protein